jgi:hypothetical protein
MILMWGNIKYFNLVFYISLTMNNEKAKKIAIDFLIYVLHTGLHNSDLTTEELYECYQRDAEEFAETIRNYGEED